MNSTIVKIENLDLTLQTRATTDAETIAEYAEQMKDGANFPPVVVFSDGASLYLADGFHRIAAANANGKDEIVARIINGNRAAALTYALKANAEHGLRRTNADKNRALEIAWANREILFKGEEPTERSLSALCCVSKTFCHNFMSKSGVVTVTSRNESKAERAAGKLLKEGKDRFGVAIPDAILDAFTSKELHKIYKQINGSRSEINKNLEGSNIAFATLSQKVLIDLSNALTAIRFSEPYCVCRACRGSGCYRCKDLGFQTRSQYNALPSEFKEATEA